MLREREREKSFIFIILFYFSFHSVIHSFIYRFDEDECEEIKQQTLFNQYFLFLVIIYPFEREIKFRLTHTSHAFSFPF
jgi:hypothetical protein